MSGAADTRKTLLTRERLAMVTDAGDLIEWFLWRCQKCSSLIPEAQKGEHALLCGEVPSA